MGDDGREVPRSETGEIWTAGPMIAREYWNDAKATAQGITGGYWHTGDIGRIDAEGYVHVSDRMKDMLNRGGLKIYSVEVENVLQQYPGSSRPPSSASPALCSASAFTPSCTPMVCPSTRPR